jgi:hypothetical protein
MSYKFATHYIYGVTHYNYIKTIHFQLLCNSIIITPMMSLIIIHILKYDMWHYEDFGTQKLFSFQNIDFHHPL